MRRPNHLRLFLNNFENKTYPQCWDYINKHWSKWSSLTITDRETLLVKLNEIKRKDKKENGTR